MDWNRAADLPRAASRRRGPLKGTLNCFIVRDANGQQIDNAQTLTTPTTFTTPFLPAGEKTAPKHFSAHDINRLRHVRRRGRSLLDDSGAAGAGTHRQILGIVMVGALNGYAHHRRSATDRGEYREAAGTQVQDTPHPDQDLAATLTQLLTEAPHSDPIGMTGTDALHQTLLDHSQHNFHLG